MKRRKVKFEFDVQSAFTNVGLILVGLVIGVPVLLALFSEGGAFNDLVALPTSGALADNQYSGILSAIILLIPLVVVILFAMRFIDGRIALVGKKRRAAQSASRKKEYNRLERSYRRRRKVKKISPKTKRKLMSQARKNVG